MLELLSMEVRLGCPGELLSGENVALVRESLVALKGRLQPSQGALESKANRVNV